MPVYKNISRADLILPQENVFSPSIKLLPGQTFNGSEHFYDKYVEENLIERTSDGWSYNGIVNTVSDTLTINIGSTIQDNGTTALLADTIVNDQVSESMKYSAFGKIYWNEGTDTYEIDFSITGNGLHGGGSIFIVNLASTPAGAVSSPVAENSEINISSGKIVFSLNGSTMENATVEIIYSSQPQDLESLGCSEYLDISNDKLMLAFDMSTTAGATNNILVDSSPMANHGIISGATLSNNGGFNGGGAVVFANPGDEIIVPQPSDPINIMTVSYWMKASSNDGIRPILVRYNKNNTAERVFEIRSSGSNDDSLIVRLWNTSGDVSEYEFDRLFPTDNTWHLVTITFAEETLRGFLDGNMITESSSISTIRGSSRYLQIGTYNTSSGDFQFVGSLDEVRIYNRALSIDEIRNLYFQRTTVNQPSLSLVSNNTQVVWSDVTINGDLTADSYIDNTPGWSHSSSDALSAILNIGYEIRDGNSYIDHNTLPVEAQAIIGYKDVVAHENVLFSSDIETTVQREPILGRDIGALVTIQNEAIRALEERIKVLENILNEKL